MKRSDHCPVGGEPCQSLCDTRCGSTDSLQGAANWLFRVLEECCVADIQSRLLIGYNRAHRLFSKAKQGNAS